MAEHCFDATGFLVSGPAISSSGSCVLLGSCDDGCVVTKPGSSSTGSAAVGTGDSCAATAGKVGCTSAQASGVRHRSLATAESCEGGAVFLAEVAASSAGV